MKTLSAQAAWNKRNPEKVALYHRRNYFKRTYGITLEEYDEMVAAQGGVCAICGGGPGRYPRLCVDHDHETGVIRGLLCNDCNRGIGLLGDNPTTVAAAAAYLNPRS